MAVNKTLLDKIQQGRQYRKVNSFEVRKAEDNVPVEDKDKYVKGYATTFNEPYTLYSDDEYEVREQVDPHAFDNCDMSDVIMQYDHEGRVFARLSNGTLELKADDHGLYISAFLGGTEEGRKLYEEIDKGYTSKMSFGFEVKSDEVLQQKEDNKVVITRTIKEFKKLYDVSAVSLPANDGTEISARSFCDGVIAEAKKEILKAEEEKRTEDKNLELRKRLALAIEFDL